MIIYKVTTRYFPGGYWFVLADDEQMAIDTVIAMEAMKKKYQESLYVDGYYEIKDFSIAQVVGRAEY